MPCFFKGIRCARPGPGAPERCNGEDDDCDGVADDGNARDLCGSGASCASGRCVLDGLVDQADLLRACALEAACIGTLSRFGQEGTVCADRLARQLTRTAVEATITIGPNDPGPGEWVLYRDARSSAEAVREAIRRARTAVTCADYLGPQYARWVRCRSVPSYCEGDLLVTCLNNGSPTGALPVLTDCSGRGGCASDSAFPSCRREEAACSLAPRDYVRCDGASIRIGCGETVACPEGSRCTARVVTESTMGTSRTAQVSASCEPAAQVVRLRCPDGSMVDAPARTCPPDPAVACAPGPACDGTRFSFCADGRRAEVDCAALTGGACAGAMCRPR